MLSVVEYRSYKIVGEPTLRLYLAVDETGVEHALLDATTIDPRPFGPTRMRYTGRNGQVTVTRSDGARQNVDWTLFEVVSSDEWERFAREQGRGPTHFAEAKT